MLALLTAALLGCAPLAHAAAPEPTSARQVGKEMSDAASAIRDYSAAKRDEAVRKTAAALRALDARIEALETQLDTEWDHMDATSRKQARATLHALRKQRIQVAEWYGSLKDSSADAWTHMKKGFADAFDALDQAWQKTERDFAAQQAAQKKE
jgi:hypothetical protein